MRDTLSTLMFANDYQGQRRWGIQTPFYFSYHSLSRSRVRATENILYFGGDIAPLIRFFREPKGGWDPYFSFGVGMDGVTEGSQNNRTAATDFNLHLELAVDYHFHDRWAAHFGVPFRGILFLGDNLSSDQTGVTSIPLSFGVVGKF